MSEAARREPTQIRIGVAGGAEQVLERLTAEFPESVVGPAGPSLASPFGGRTLLDWLRERLAPGASIWTLRLLNGERLDVRVIDTDAIFAWIDADERGRDTSTRPVHDIRNCLNVVQMNAELMQFTVEREKHASLAEPLARIQRQIAPMNAALELISARERARFGLRHDVRVFLQQAVDRTAWAGKLALESGSRAQASAACCEALTRSVFEWTSHALATEGRARIAIADVGEGLGFAGSGIADWAVAAADREALFRAWFDRWAEIGVAAGVWSDAAGGGALIGLPP